MGVKAVNGSAATGTGTATATGTATMVGGKKDMSMAEFHSKEEEEMAAKQQGDVRTPRWVRRISSEQ